MRLMFSTSYWIRPNWRGRTLALYTTDLTLYGRLLHGFSCRSFGIHFNLQALLGGPSMEGFAPPFSTEEGLLEDVAESLNQCAGRELKLALRAPVYSRSSSEGAQKGFSCPNEVRNPAIHRSLRRSRRRRRPDPDSRVSSRHKNTSSAFPNI